MTAHECNFIMHACITAKDIALVTVHMKMAALMIREG
jgi:hypothetical protein